VPKKEFLNLNVEKQQKIMNAARKEFTSMVYEDASINMIVKEAGISRGAFYCYFENKKDIYLYVMMNEVRSIVDNLVLGNQRGKISLFNAAIRLYDQVMDFYRVTENQELIKNIIHNMSMDHEKQAIELYSEYIVNAVKNRVSLDGVNYKNDQELLVIISMVVHIVLEAIFLTMFKNVDCKTARRGLQFKMNIIEKGVKEESK